jgi:hypothetical protein
VDVRVGPFVFPRTRIGEARVEGGLQDAHGAAVMKGEAETTAKPSDSSERAFLAPAAVPFEGKTRESTSAPPSAVHVAGKSTAAALTPIGSGVNTPTRATSPPPKNGCTSTPKPAVNPAPPAVINDRVVKAMSAAAQRDESLQRLLHSAANGKASPEQLRELAAIIAKISEALDKADKEAPSGAASTIASAASTPASTPQGKGQAALAKKEAKKRMPDGNVKVKKAPKKALSSERGAERLIPPPTAFASTPSYPPMITVEFRENPSARFLLPLWRDATVERRTDGGRRSIKLTMLLPAIGSSAASRAAGEGDVLDDPSNMTKKKKKSKAKAKDAETSSETAQERTYSPLNPPTDAELRNAPPPGAETRPVTWTISGSDAHNITDGIWDVFGRVRGVETYVNGTLQTSREGESDKANATNEKEVPYDVLTALITKLRAMPPDCRDLARMPKLRLRADDVPRDLAEQLSDKFVPRMQTVGLRPIVRIRRTTGGDDDKDQFDVLRGMTSYDDKRKRVRLDGEPEYQRDTGDEDGVGDESGNVQYDPVTGLPIKRKRHVAKYNPDGTLKLCQACGTNVTPMWRRGPAGKSTLCNACGAKWKVGRLVVPDKMPTASIETVKAQEPGPSVVQKDSVDGAGTETAIADEGPAPSLPIEADTSKVEAAQEAAQEEAQEETSVQQ